MGGREGFVLGHKSNTCVDHLGILFENKREEEQIHEGSWSEMVGSVGKIHGYGRGDAA